MKNVIKILILFLSIFCAPSAYSQDNNELKEVADSLTARYHSLKDSAFSNYQMGNYAESIRLGTEALNIAERVFGKNHINYATILSYLEGYNSYMGNYAEAIRHGTEALNIAERESSGRTILIMQTL